MPDALPHALHYLDGQAQAVFEAAAPLVIAIVRALRRELVDEIALGGHDLDAIVAGFSRECRRDGEVLDRALDVGGRHAPGLQRIDGRGQRRRPNEALVLCVAARVQDLQRDASTLGVHGARYVTVVGNVLRAAHFRAIGAEESLRVR